MAALDLSASANSVSPKPSAPHVIVNARVRGRLQPAMLGRNQTCRSAIGSEPTYTKLCLMIKDRHRRRPITNPTLRTWHSGCRASQREDEKSGRRPKPTRRRWQTIEPRQWVSGFLAGRLKEGVAACRRARSPILATWRSCPPRLRVAAHGDLGAPASLQTHQGSTEGRKVGDWHDDLHEKRRRGPFGLNCVVKS